MAFSGDPGEGDGLPTSGAGTKLPGEPHIDKTDIDETDMLGLTSFKLYEWPDMPHYEDELVWKNMIPGYFDDLLENINVELFYGSGYFPMIPAQIERFSMGIFCGISLDDFMINKYWFAKAYNENYNFAKAPNIPNVRAIVGDKRVTLVWDDIAEQSVDPIGGRDFEGYRIYRSTDPGWNDMTPITDGYGSKTFLKPLAQFDLVNEHQGYAPISIKGIRFYLGSNTGIVHTWTDTTVVNGQKYYYAVTAYDHGMPAAGIAPSECSKFISISTSGQVDKGPNVVIVRPEAPVAGFRDADLENLHAVEGGLATGKIGYEVLDPTKVPMNGQYQIVFEDTVIKTAANTFTMVTKNFSLIDKVTGKRMIDRSTNLEPGAEQPITDGFRLKLFNEAETAVPTGGVTASSLAMYGPVVSVFRYSKIYGTAAPNDYVIEFGEVGIDTSKAFVVSTTRTLPVMPVNFTVKNLNSGEKVAFAFWENDALKGEEGKMTAFTDKTRTDQIIFLEEIKGETVPTWSLSFDSATRDSLHRNPLPGETITIRTIKPFLARDVYEFTTSAQSIDNELAKAQLDRIKVVPNPYIVSNSWEPINPYSNGRGPRELHFIHLPKKCTVRIFNVRGQLVRELEHESDSLNDGTLIWDMQTKDLLDISYGVYIYHVDAGELGTKIGKFAVIK